MLFFISFILILFTSLFITASLRVSSRSAYLISIFLLSYANNTLVGLLANLLLMLNRVWVWLALELILLGIAFIAWNRFARPPLLGPFTQSSIPINLSRFKRWARAYPDLFILMTGVSLSLLFAALMNLVVPPNNNDSMGTHLSRVIHWLFNGSFFPWDTPRIMQLFYPVNAQLQLFWTILFWGSDLWAGFVQYFSGIACLVAVYGISREIGANRNQALFAAFTFGSFPVFLLQLSTPQNDLVTGGLFASLIFLLITGIKKNRSNEILLSGLAFGLAIGTKQTMLFLLPGLGILIWLLWKYVSPKPISFIKKWGLSIILFTLIFGIYINISNIIHFRHPLGPPEEVNRSTSGTTVSSFLVNITLNTTRLLYQMLDPSGIPDPLWGYSIKLKALVLKPVFDLLQLPIEGSVATATGHSFNLRYRPLLQEDSAWYGPLGFFLFLPVQIFQLIKGIRTRDTFRTGFPLIFLTFLLADAAFRPGWDPFQSRYFLPAIAVGSSLVGFTFQNSPRSLYLRWITTLLAWMVMVSVAFLNSAKPIVGDQTIWTMDRTAKLTIQGHFMLDVTRMVDREIPPDAVAGMLNFGANWEYPLFGERFTRRIIPIHPIDRLYDPEWLKARDIQFVIIQATREELPDIPRYLTPVSGYYAWVIYRFSP